MGILRLLFALSVIIVHAYPFGSYQLLGAELAINSFFILSGFYMALILTEKYVGRHSYRLFITSRFLRIFPTYWLFLILTFLFALIKLHSGNQQSVLHFFIQHITASQTPFLATFILVSHNITLLITDDFFNSGFNQFLLIPQAWTLQVELLFYLVAPLLIKLPKKLLLLLTGFFFSITFFSYPLHISETSIGNAAITRFSFFLLGITAFSLYKKGYFLPKNKGKLLLIAFIAFSVIYKLITISNDLTYYIPLILLVPTFFTLTKNVKLDRRLGDLSYAMYISHFFFFKIITNIHFITNKTLVTVSTVIVTTLFSFLVVKFLEEPIDRFRHTRLTQLLR